MGKKDAVAGVLGLINMVITLLLFLAVVQSQGQNIIMETLLSNSAYAVGYTLMWIGWGE